MACPNGHGGCGSVEPPAPVLANAEEPPADEVLPGTADEADVTTFLDDKTETAMPSRRAVEEADEELDIDSILANFS